MAAGQGGNDVQDMSTHTPNMYSIVDQMGNATVSSVNGNNTPDVVRSLQAINEHMINMQREILSLKTFQASPGTRGIKRSREVIDPPLSGHDLNNDSDQEEDIDTFLGQSSTEAQEGENSDNEWVNLSDCFENDSDTG